MRKLKDGSEAEELESAVDLTIHTKCPSKWLLTDLETGQQYIRSNKPNLYSKWIRINNIESN